MGIQFPPLKVSLQCSEPQLHPSSQKYLKKYLQPSEVTGIWPIWSRTRPKAASTDGNRRAARMLRQPVALTMRRLFTAGTSDTVHCKRPSFQPFPSGEGREAIGPGLCLPPARERSGENGDVPHGLLAAAPRGGQRRLSKAGTRPAGSASRPAASVFLVPLGPPVCVIKRDTEFQPT